MARKSKALPDRKGSDRKNAEKGGLLSKMKAVLKGSKPAKKPVNLKAVLAKTKPAAPAAPIEKAKAALKTVAKKEVSKPAAKEAAPKTAAPKVARPALTMVKAPEPVVEVTPAPAAKKAKGKKISIDIKPNEAASALSVKWASLYKKAEQIESKPYNMKAAFEEKTAIVHKVLGWGYILANRNDRLEVLFKDGIKYLISNYKA